MEGLLSQITNLFVILILLSILGFVFALVGYVFVLWYRWKDREDRSLDMVTLLIAVPQDNEVKVDAMEPILAALTSIKKSAKFKWLQFLIAQPCVVLEIVGTKDDIRFYISTPKKIPRPDRKAALFGLPGSQYRNR